jgi:hypothetical protein
MPPKKKYVLVRNEEPNYVLTSGNEAAAEEALRAVEAEAAKPKKVKVKKTAVAAAPIDPVPVAPVKSRKKKYVLVRNAPVAAARPTDEEIVRAIPVTLGDEVQAALEEWYRARGEALPAEYVGFGTQVDAEERARDKALMDALYPPEPAPGAPAAPKPLGPKPEFGTPEFWRWTAARRKQIDAERAAQGLPPLPTKKEKEAAKQSRKAAREAKAAAKKK